jgi:hypothetical protein
MSHIRLLNVQTAAQEASEGFELVALETLGVLGTPSIRSPQDLSLTRMLTLNRECGRAVVDL